MASVWPAKNNYATGDILTAANMNSVGDDLNDVYGYSFTNNFFAGKNKIINGNFGVWQRGTSFSGITSATYTADRFQVSANVAVTASQQTFTPGTAPIAGYEGTYYHRISCGATTSYVDFAQKIEDVRAFAGQTVTLSFWAKADSAVTWTVFARQNFGSGGSVNVDTSASATASLTTSWQRFTMQIVIPSINGKTIGTSSYLQIVGYINGATANSRVIDFWGVQLEAGSVATPFTTATGTIQGELAACQRYYQRAGGANVYQFFGVGNFYTATAGNGWTNFPVTMRTTPTSVDFSNLRTNGPVYNAISAVTIAATAGPNGGGFDMTSTGQTTNSFVFVQANNSTSAYLGFSAEL